MLKEILGDVDTVIPDHLDQLTLWKIILNMVSENHIKSNYFRGNHVLVETRLEITLGVVHKLRGQDELGRWSIKYPGLST